MGQSDRRRQLRAAQPPIQPASQEQHVGSLAQSHESRGPAHDQGRVLVQQQPQAGDHRRDRRQQLREPELRERHGECLRHVVRVRQCGHRQLHLVLPEHRVYRGQLHLLQPRRLRAGQLEGDRPPDARLRRPLRDPEAAVRFAVAGWQFSAGSLFARGRAGALRAAAPTGCIPAREPTARR